ncbi:MAG: hypothetical protein HY706_07010 [Candidatus Hydrogenedentes bacterium]|nr:hypothetical protein [Candidatus Hydrogenedentota bacterium]
MKTAKRGRPGARTTARVILVGAASLGVAILVAILLVSRDLPRVRPQELANQTTAPASFPTPIQKANINPHQVTPATHSRAPKQAAPVTAADIDQMNLEAQMVRDMLLLAHARRLKKAREEEIKNEPVEQTIAKLMEDPLANITASTDAAYLRQVLNEPRVRKLLGLARDGNDAERKWLAERVIDELTSALHGMPSYTAYGERWQPCLIAPGGTLALVLVVSEVEPPPRSLEIVLDAHRLVQGGWAEYAERYWNENNYTVAPAKQGVLTKSGMILAYACDRILSCWAVESQTPNVPGPGVPSNLLTAYSGARGKWVDDTQDYFDYQTEILDWGDRVLSKGNNVVDLRE